MIFNWLAPTPGRFTTGATPPITMGNWARPATSNSAGFSGLSVAPKSTVFAFIWAMPHQEPMAW